MEHIEAKDGQAAARYLLREMTEAERETFEDHFFACPECAAEVEAGVALMEAALVPSSEPVLTPAKGFAWLTWWKQPMFAAPAFAAVLLASVVGYQSRQLALSNRAQALASYTLLPDRRGENGNRIQLRAGARSFAVNVDLPDKIEFPQYRCTLYGPAHELRFQVVTAPPRDGIALGILVPAREMGSGAYIMKVEGLSDGNASHAVASYPFDLSLDPGSQ